MDLFLLFAVTLMFTLTFAWFTGGEFGDHGWGWGWGFALGLLFPVWGFFLTVLLLPKRSVSISGGAAGGRNGGVSKSFLKAFTGRLLLISFGGFISGINAQTIESSSHSTTGYVKPDGTITDSSHSTKGYIKSDGTIENASHSTIGYIKKDGTIENSNHSTVGYVKSDGTVENASHSTVGYIKEDGTVENASHSTVGYAKGVSKEWAAAVFFFFKFK